MKLISFLILTLAISSCGPIQPIQENEEGNNRKIERRFLKGTQEEEKIQAICSALDGKEIQLQELKNTRKTLSVGYRFKSCSGKVTNYSKGALVSSISFGDYVFVEATNNLLPLPAAETLSSGIMKEICASKADLITPITSGRNVISFTALSAGYENCPSDENHVCMQVSYGLMNEDGESFKPSELHYVSFKIAGEKKGFYVSRMKRSFPIDCQSGEEMVQIFR